MNFLYGLFLLLIFLRVGHAGENANMTRFDIKTLDIEDNWSSKEVGYKDSELITFFRKNLGVAKISKHPELKHLVYLTVKYTPDNVRGFPSKEDYALISQFEDSALPKIESSSNSIHVASVLKNGIYDFLFYVSDPNNFLKSYNTNNELLKKFSVELEFVQDANWEIYKDFP